MRSPKFLYRLWRGLRYLCAINIGFKKQCHAGIRISAMRPLYKIGPPVTPRIVGQVYVFLGLLMLWLFGTVALKGFRVCFFFWLLKMSIFLVARRSCPSRLKLPGLALSFCVAIFVSSRFGAIFSLKMACFGFRGSYYGASVLTRATCVVACGG